MASIVGETDGLVLRVEDYQLEPPQVAARAIFQEVLSSNCSLERVRRSEGDGYDADLWRDLIDLGVLEENPTGLGGQTSLGLGELVLLTEEHGRYLAPVPLEEALAATRLLAAILGLEDPGMRRVLTGANLVTLALRPARAGAPQLVPAGAIADDVVGLIGEDLVLVHIGDLPRRGLVSHGHAPVAWLDIGAGGADGTVLASGASAREGFHRACREWRLLMAGALVGIAEASLQVAAKYARQRHAFGTPIGTFQAISHSLADVAIAVATARRLVWKAGWFMEHEPVGSLHRVPMAYLYAYETALRATEVGIHVLGGHGFTLDADMHLYFRRVKAWALVDGDPKRSLLDIAAVLYGPARASDVSESIPS